MALLSREEVVRRKAEESKNLIKDIATSQEKILKKLDESPKVDTSKVQAVAKVAYDKADTALKIATNQNSLVKQMTKAIEGLKTDKNITGYKMKINRNAEGFMESIDVEIQ